jgi:transposase
LGRSLDAFFTQRHSIHTTVAAQIIQLAELSLDRLHFDPTHLHFYGAYESSQSRPEDTPWPPTNSRTILPAHITHGYGDDAKLIQVGVTSVVDELGAVPLLGQCLDGNQNGHTAIRQQCDWLRAEGLLRPGALMISDRGTFSVEHVARLHRHDCRVLCSVPWEDYRALYDTNAAQLN